MKRKNNESQWTTCQMTFRHMFSRDQVLLLRNLFFHPQIFYSQNNCLQQYPPHSHLFILQKIKNKIPVNENLQPEKKNKTKITQRFQFNPQE